MENVLPTLRIDSAGEEPTSHSAQPVQEITIPRVELLLQLFANALRERRTMSSGGDGDLQISALHHGRVIEVAAIRFVDGVAEDAAQFGFAVNPFVHFRIACRRNYQCRVVEIGGSELALRPAQPSVTRKFLNQSSCLWRDDVNIGTGTKQAVEFLFGDGARTGNQHASAL